jgi:anti-sigma-K factor RskA
MNSRFVPRIDKPCSAAWDKMAGDEKRRFCEHCQLHVHNLSEMTTQEQVAFMKAPGERKCVIYSKPTNAKPVDAGTWLSFQSTSGWRKAVAAMLAAMFSLFTNSCRTTAPTSDQRLILGKVKNTQQVSPASHDASSSGKEALSQLTPPGGIIFPPTPWWKKILFMDY